ncbi:MAG: hypothetical protein J6N32_11615 [Clostridia bacterium]|nr:hypothetical protein [Oscillospiraceae bacterium]MBO4931737.1 hypothetical protein [Clostridia bacterium]MBO5256065.1 hypothetical protein [Clostridia bacterium]MBP3294391.1 hypothetical protein [Clostridia bacterium]MBQ7312307.1 hypothetical protein [Clostridia bacterium]
MKECKRCLLRESAENDTFENIRGRIDRLRPEEKADEELYERRLNACRECDHLISGICMKCGCYVEFRAAFRQMKCPNVSDRKW